MIQTDYKPIIQRLRAFTACCALLLLGAALACAEDRSGIVADSVLDQITGANPINADEHFSQIPAPALFDLAISSDNRRAYGLAIDGGLVEFAIDRSGDAPELTVVGVRTFPVGGSRPQHIALSPDGRMAYVADRRRVASINLVPLGVRSGGQSEQRAAFTYGQQWTPNPDKDVIDLEVHPDGERLVVLIDGLDRPSNFDRDGELTDEIVNADPPEALGMIAIYDISGDVSRNDVTPVEIVKVPIGFPLYDLHSLTLSPDGNYALITARGLGTVNISPFGVRPDPDEGTGGILVFDLNNFEVVAYIPTVVDGEHTHEILQDIVHKGLTIQHPTVTIFALLAQADEAIGFATTLLSVTGGGAAAGIGVVMQLQAAQNQAALAIYQDTYQDYGPMAAYANAYPTDMVSASGVAITRHGDFGIVTFEDTNNVGFLRLRPSLDIRGYHPGNRPDFQIIAASEKIVNALDLDFGINNDFNTFTHGLSWLFFQEASVTSDDSYAYIGMNGGPSVGEANHVFATVDLTDVRRTISTRGAAVTRRGLLLNEAFGGLFGSRSPDDGRPEFVSPRDVATFHPVDTDGDSLSDLLEAFNRFNDYKVVPFGDKSQLVSTSVYSITNPSVPLVQNVYPFHHGDLGFFLPHSGLGYRYNYNGHFDFSTNVGHAIAVTTIERAGRDWHNRFLDGEVGRPYFIVTDMSHPGESVIQNEHGEFRHFNVRNGFQANVQYFSTGSDDPFEFVLSNGPASPVDNTDEGDLGNFDAGNTDALIRAFLAMPAVEKIVMDPKPAQMLGFVGNPRIEIHGFLEPADNDDIDNNGRDGIDEPGEPNSSRRDMDNYMMVVFRNLQIAIDDAVVLEAAADGSETVNMIVLDPDADITVRSVKIDTSVEGATSFRVTTQGVTLYFDPSLQTAVTGDIMPISNIDGALWIAASGPTSGVEDIHIDVDLLDGEDAVILSGSYAAGALELDLDIGGASITPNSGDSDGDKVPDYADGFNLDRVSGTGDSNGDTIPDNADDSLGGASFAAFTVSIRGPLDLSREPVLRFEYDMSDPGTVFRATRPSDFVPFLGGFMAVRSRPWFRPPESGSLRIWEKPLSQQRTLEDFLPAADHFLSDIGLSSPGSKTFYIEAVAPVANAEIRVLLDPDGFTGPLGFVAQDVELIAVSASNRLDIAFEGLSEEDEDIGNSLTQPGQLIAVNDVGGGAEGKPGYADFSGAAGRRFVRLQVALPAVADPEEASVLINYSASDPGQIEESGVTGLRFLPGGHLRLWRADGNQSRNPVSARAGGDYFEPGAYTLAQLPASGVFYVEAVRPSSDIADQRIVMQLDPNGLGAAFEDAVRLTVYDQNWEDTYAIDADYRRCDINGQPMAEAEPQSEPEEDLRKDGFYVDAYTLTPTYSTTDVSIPLLGPGLKMEFRRTASVNAFLAGSSSAAAINAVGEDFILGKGWRSNLGMRVVREHGVFTVYDDNGQAHRYNDTGQPVPHSFLEATTHRTDLQIIRVPDNPDIVGQVVWTRNFWTQYVFESYDPNPADFGSRPVVGQIFRLAQIIDNNGNTIECKYDDQRASYPSEMFEKDFPAKKIQFTYQQNGTHGLRLQQLIDPNGNTYFYRYDGEVNLSEVALPEPNADVGSAAGSGAVESYRYHEQSVGYDDGTTVVFLALAEVTNANDNVTQFDYTLDERNLASYPDGTKAMRLAAVRSGVGSDVQAGATFAQIDFSTAGAIVEVVDARGVTWRYEFATALIPSSLQNGVGYPVNGFTIAILDRFERTAQLSGGEPVWRFEFSNDTFSNLQEVEDSFGNVVHYSYGKHAGFDHSRYSRPLEKLVDLRDDDHSYPELKSRFEYDFSTRKLLKTIGPRHYTGEDLADPDAHSIANEYDDRRNRTDSSEPYTDIFGNRHVQRHVVVYDSHGIPARSLDPDGRLETIERQILGNRWKDIITTYKEYAPAGIAKSRQLQQLSLGSFTPYLVKEMEYDLNGNLVRESVTYDDPDSSGTITDVTDYTIDAANNTVRIEEPAVADGESNGALSRPTVERTYDGMGNLTSEVNARGTITDYAFDARDRQIESVTIIEQGVEIETTTIYDATGNVVRTIDPNGNETISMYDGLDRLVEAQRKNEYTDPSGQPVGGSVDTVYEYGLNSGSNVFVDDEWQATRIVDPRGMATVNTYDSAYRLVQVERLSGPLGGGTQLERYTLDGNSNVTQKRVGNDLGSGDQVTNTKYDEMDRVIQTEIVVAGGNIVVQELYDKAGHVVAEIDPDGFVSQTAYDTLGLPAVEVVRLTGGVSFVPQGAYEFAIDESAVNDDDILTQSEYDGRKNLIRETLQRYDESGDTLIEIMTEHRYDPLNRVVETIENADGNIADGPDERIKRFVYDHNDNVTQEIIRRESPNNPNVFVDIVTDHVYDNLDRLIMATLPEVADGENGRQVTRPTLRKTYDKNGNLLTEVNPRGMVARFHYDGLDRQIRSVLNADGNPNAVHVNDIVVMVDYDANDNIVRQTMRRQESVHEPQQLVDVVHEMVYDGFNREVRREDPDGNLNLIAYDTVGNAISITDRNGNTTNMEYDTANRLLKTVQPPVTALAPGSTSGAVGGHRPTATVEYNRRSLEVRAVDANGNVTLTEYDGARRVVAVTNPAGDTATYEYNQANDTVAETDFRGLLTQHRYDRLNRRVETVDPAGLVTASVYDVSDNLLQTIDEKERLTSYRYDLADRRIEEHHPENSAPIRYSYTLTGQQATKTDENGLTTVFEYDFFDRHVRTIDHDGNVTTMEYDQADNMVRTVDAEGSVTVNRYDLLDRLIAVEEELGRTTEYEYDPNGNRTSIKDGNGFSTIFVYDALHRLVLHEFPTGEQYEYVYDRKLNIGIVVTPNGSSILQRFDALDRLITRFYPGHEYTFTYDANSNPLSITHRALAFNETWQTINVWDNRDLLISTTFVYPGLSSRVIAYTYDDAGVREQVTTPNGRVIRYETDAEDRFTEIRGDLGIGMMSANFVYDDASRTVAKNYGNGVQATDVYNNRNFLLQSVSRHASTDREIVGFEYDYTRVNFRRFEKEIFTQPTAAAIKVAADVYQYDKLYRVTGAKYGAAAVVSTTVGPLTPPVSPGNFAAAENPQRTQIFDFDPLNNRQLVQDTIGTTLYNNDGGGYDADLFNRIQSYTSFAYDAPGDAIIFDGRDGSHNPTLTEGQAGIQGPLYFHDANSNTAYDSPEDLWSDNTVEGANGAFDRNADVALLFYNDGVDTILVGDTVTPDSWGRPSGLYYFDFNQNDEYDIGEDFWYEVPAVEDGEYDAGVDRLFAVFDAGPESVLRGDPIPTGSLGLNAGLYFHDANDNDVYDSGEDVWYDAANATYIGGVATLVDGGADGFHLVDGTVGKQTNLFYFDADRDGGLDTTESIWINEPLFGAIGKRDLILYTDGDNDGIRDETESIWLNESIDGVEGRNEFVFFHDANFNQGWDIDEGVWEEQFDDSDVTTTEYDANGNLTRDGVVTYTWSARNELESVADNGTPIVRYVYDQDGRRLVKIRPDGSRTYYYYDDWDVILEVDQNGVARAEYLIGRGMDEPLAAVIAGQPIYFHQNAIGNVAALTNTNGDVVERYDYDIYGNVAVLNPDGAVVGGVDLAVSPYLFTGRRYDAETGLYEFRKRYYTPAHGRFISTDPLDYIDGMNVYAYVNGNVVNLTDPTGQFLGIFRLFSVAGKLARFSKTLLSSSRLLKAVAKLPNLGRKLLKPAVSLAGKGMAKARDWAKGLKTALTVKKTPPIDKIQTAAKVQKTASYSKLARQATKSGQAQEVVLGKFRQGFVSYVKVAKDRKATYFQLDKWDDVVKAVGQKNIWKINKAFLKQQHAAGKAFVLSHNPAKATGYFLKEVNLLKKMGYTFKKESSLRTFWKPVWRAVK